MFIKGLNEIYREQFATKEEFLKKLVSVLLDGFERHYGSGYSYMYRNQKKYDLVEHWSGNLQGITPKQIKIGAEKWSAEFPPNVPQFRKICLGLPFISPQGAYFEAVEGLRARERGEFGEWRHPSIYFAAAEMKTDLLTKTWKENGEAWKYVLDKHIEKKHEEIPPPRQSTKILEKERSRSDEETILARENIKKIAEMLNIRSHI
jgi:hypothetical protein